MSEVAIPSGFRLPVIWAEFKVLFFLAAPTIIQGAAQQGMLMTDQIFLGHLGTVSLAAAALGTTYSNIMWWVPLSAWEQEPVERFLACKHTVNSSPP